MQDNNGDTAHDMKVQGRLLMALSFLYLQLLRIADEMLRFFADL